VPVPAAVLIPSLIGAGGSIGASLLGNRKQTSTSTPILSPQQQGLQNQLISRSQQKLNTPFQAPDLTPLRSQARTQVNRAGESSRRSLEERLSGRGFGRSGKVEQGFRDIDVAGINAFSGIESTILQEIERQRIEEEQRKFENARSLLPNSGGFTQTSQGGNSTLPLTTLLALASLTGTLGSGSKKGSGSDGDSGTFRATEFGPGSPAFQF